MGRLKLSFSVHYSNGKRSLELVGQYARTLRELINAGSKGITAGEVSMMGWGYRLGHYVHILRTVHNLNIETLREEHNGEAGKGWHGRYVLHTNAKLLTDGEAT